MIGTPEIREAEEAEAARLASERPQGVNEVDAELGRLIREAQARYNALSPEDKAAHDQAQKESLVRAMMPTSDPRSD